MFFYENFDENYFLGPITGVYGDIIDDISVAIHGCIMRGLACAIYSRALVIKSVWSRGWERRGRFLAKVASKMSKIKKLKPFL